MKTLKVLSGALILLLSVNTITFGQTKSSKGVWLGNNGYVYLKTLTDKVGIGTETPYSNIHIFSNAEYGNEETYSGIRLENKLKENQAWDIKTGEYILNFKFGVQEGDVKDFYSKMSLNSVGNLGLGTKSPLTAFHIFKADKDYNPNQQNQDFIPSVRFDYNFEKEMHHIWDIEADVNRLNLKFAKVQNLGEITNNKIIVESQKNPFSFSYDNEKPTFTIGEYEKFDIQMQDNGLAFIRYSGIIGGVYPKSYIMGNKGFGIGITNSDTNIAGELHLKTKNSMYADHSITNVVFQSDSRYTNWEYEEEEDDNGNIEKGTILNGEYKHFWNIKSSNFALTFQHAMASEANPIPSYSDFVSFTKSKTQLNNLLKISSNNPDIYLNINSSSLSTTDIKFAKDGVVKAKIFWDKNTNKLTLNNGVDALSIDNNGNVEIGNSTKNFWLKDGYVYARELIVQADGAYVHPDYVFEPNYKPISLKELEEYIKENKHLPEVPSAAQVAKEGLKIGEMNTVLLKKIEELTLYVIELQKQVDKLQNK